MSRKLLSLIHCKFQITVLRESSPSSLEFSIHYKISFSVALTTCTSPELLLNLSTEVPAPLPLKQKLFQAQDESATECL